MDDIAIFLFTKIASTATFMVIVAVILALMLGRGLYRASFALLSGAGLMGVSVATLKETFRIPRLPDALVDASGYAFPSGHAAASMFLAVMAMCALWRLKNPWQRYGLSGVALALALAIGVSRVVYIVHTTLQVIAGFALGAGWAVCTWHFIVLGARSDKARENR